MQEIYDYSVLGNTILIYLTALAVFIGGMVAVYAFKRYALVRLKIWAESTTTSFDDLLINAIDKSLVPFLYIGAFYIALHTLVLSTEFRSGMRVAAIVLLTVLAVRAVTSAVNFGLRSYLKKTDNLERGEKQLKGIRALHCANTQDYCNGHFETGRSRPPNTNDQMVFNAASAAS